MIEFRAFGPFELPREETRKGIKRISKLIKPTNGLLKTEFWLAAADRAEDFGVPNLAKAKGLYVFGLKVGKGFTPYYVGKTGKQTLSTEPFTAGKILLYNGCIAEWKGTPVMFFLPLPKRKGPDNQKVIAIAEKFMIEMAYTKNPAALLNTKQAKKPEWAVRGVLRTQGKGASTTDTRDFKAMMGL